MPTAISGLKSGKVLPLAITSAKRSRILPAVPTVSEAGVPGFVSANWVGLTAPKGTPAAVIGWLHKQAVATLAAPEVRERLDSLGAEVSGLSPEEFGQVLRDDAKRWSEVIRAAGIKPE